MYTEVKEEKPVLFFQYWIKEKDHPLPGFDFVLFQFTFSKWKTETGRMRFWHIVFLNFGVTIKRHRNEKI